MTDEELEERLRQSGIRVDREGRFIHDGDPVLHEGLARALHRWLDRLPDGRYVLRLDADRFAYLDVEDTPLVARGLRWAGDGAVLTLSDGTEEPLDVGTLTVDGEGTFRCLARAGRLPARLSSAAAAALADRISETPAGPALRTAPGRAVVIPSWTPGSPR